MTLHYKTPRQYPESSQTIPRPFQTPSRHLQDTPQTPKIWALFVHTIPVGVKQAANKNESNGMFINCLHIIPPNHNPESPRQPPDTSQTPSRHPTDTPNLGKFWLSQGHWEKRKQLLRMSLMGCLKSACTSYPSPDSIQSQTPDTSHNPQSQVWYIWPNRDKDLFDENEKVFVQSARFGAGCYIKMSLSYHQPHQHRFVNRWKLIFGENGL